MKEKQVGKKEGKKRRKKRAREGGRDRRRELPKHPSLSEQLPFCKCPAGLHLPCWSASACTGQASLGGDCMGSVLMPYP